jgi:L-ascorbate metabolism protein UlaG (beta-lactamase superfamily)
MMRHTLLLFLVFMALSCKDTKKEAKTNDQDEAAEMAVPDSTAPSTTLDEKVEVIPIEHASAVIQWNGLQLFVDPVGGPEAYAPYGNPDVILITDIHGDHFDLATLQGMDTSGAKIVVPPAVAEKMPDAFTPQLDILKNGESKERFEIHIEAIPMYNLREEAKDFHVKGRGNGYVLNMGGQRIYFSGDTEDIPEMRNLEHIDKAFICMNLPYTMTVESAASAVLDFAPKQVYPYHYRGRPEVSNVSKFKSLVNAGNPDIEVVQLDWYPEKAQ